MDQRLRARKIVDVPSPDGPQADLVLIEPNGDECPVRCLIRPDRTEIAGDGDSIDYLNTKYGEPNVCSAARQAVLGASLD